MHNSRIVIRQQVAQNCLLAAVLKRLLGEVKSVFIAKVPVIIQSEWLSELTEAKNGNALIVVKGLCCRNIAANVEALAKKPLHKSLIEILMFKIYSNA